jgi:hypothetical protein
MSRTRPASERADDIQRKWLAHIMISAFGQAVFLLSASGATLMFEFGALLRTSTV